VDSERGTVQIGQERNSTRGVAIRVRPNKFLTRLLLAGVEGEFLGANHLAVQGAGNERFAFGFAGLGIGDGDLIDLERAPDSALVIGLGFGEVGQSAEFRALCVDEVALRLNDEVYGRCAQLILFLLSIERLLLQFARLAGGIDLGAVLGERDVGIADVEKRGVFQLLQLRLELTLRKNGALVIRLRRTVADGNSDGKLDIVIGKLVVKNLAQCPAYRHYSH